MAKRPQLTGRAAILAVVVCAIAMSLAYPVREYISQRRNITALQAEKARVQAEQRKLAEDLRRQADPNFQKREARERLHYCDAGTKCYVVMPPKTAVKQQQGGAQGQQQAAGPPWYQTLWESVEAVDTGKGSKVDVGAQGGQ
ncbi:septum formation initiator family protein [Nonomuraea sp. NPDC050556]|uniref:septum formation initiator family protein n=1 Tax=Nonomuraea sp. NPDC050556 TaxID=3364369 RepID=UPI0037B83FD5